MYFLKKYFAIVLSLPIFFLSSCSFFKSMAGANIDAEQFDKARQAKIMKLRYDKAKLMSEKLNQSSKILNSDIIVNMDKAMLLKVAKQYEQSKGWIDPQTNYVIKAVNLELNNGSAIISFELLAHNNKYNVDVNLVMDCLLTFELEKNDLITNIEPFNIVPQAKAGLLLKSTEEIIENLVKINLGNLSKNFPPMKMPINFANNFTIAGSKTDVKDKVNLMIINPERQINYNLKISDIYVYETKVVVAMNIENLKVK